MKKVSLKRVLIYVFIFGSLFALLFGFNYVLKSKYGLSLKSIYNKVTNRKPNGEIRFHDQKVKDNFKGFDAKVLIDNLNKPRALVFDKKNNRLFIADEGSNRIIVASIKNEKELIQSVYLENIESPHGLAFYNNVLYISTPGKVYYAIDNNNDNINDDLYLLTSDLPVGLNTTNNIEIGPDGFLYIAQGARSDHGEEEVLENEGAILRMNINTGKYSVVANGFRNPIDLAFHPQTVELFVGDQSFTKPFKNIPDELNIVFPNTSYGWPHCVGENIGTKCDESVFPLLELPKFSNIAGLEFNYDDEFPYEYKHNLFIALMGSPYKDKDVFSGIIRVELLEKSNGYTTQVHHFASGFQEAIDLVFDNEGNLLVADYQAGKVYKIKANYE